MGVELTDAFLKFSNIPFIAMNTVAEKLKKFTEIKENEIDCLLHREKELEKEVAMLNRIMDSQVERQRKNAELKDNIETFIFMEQSTFLNGAEGQLSSSKCLKDLFMLKFDKENLGRRKIEDLTNMDSLVAPKIWHCLSFLIEWQEEYSRPTYLDLRKCQSDTILANPNYWRILENNNIIKYNPKNNSHVRLNEIFCNDFLPLFTSPPTASHLDYHSTI